MFFQGNTYLQLLVKLAAFAAANPAAFRELWSAIVAAYTKAMELAGKAKVLFGNSATPDEGTLQLVAATDEELDAEDKLAAIISPEGTQALRDAGMFRAVLTWLVSTEAGRDMIANVLKYLGS